MREKKISQKNSQQRQINAQSIIPSDRRLHAKGEVSTPLLLQIIPSFIRPASLIMF
jgi:hypothetical protein